MLKFASGFLGVLRAAARDTVQQCGAPTGELLQTAKKRTLEKTPLYGSILPSVIQAIPCCMHWGSGWLSMFRSLSALDHGCSCCTKKPCKLEIVDCRGILKDVIINFSLGELAEEGGPFHSHILIKLMLPAMRPLAGNVYRLASRYREVLRVVSK